MKIKLYTILFILFSFYKLDASVYFASTNEIQKIDTNTNETLQIERTKEILKPNFKLNSTNSFLKMENNTIIDSKGVMARNFIPDEPFVSHPFRYTEVTFIISAAFAFAYASLATMAVYNLQNNFIVQLPEKNTYQSLSISTTVFQVFSGVAVASAVAYDSYQRVYGKKKKDTLSFNFTPFYDIPKKDAGFLFSLSYPLKSKITL